MRAASWLLAAAAIAASAGPVLAAERLLVQEADLLVVVDRETACGDPVPITIRTSDPAIFRADSGNRLQQTVDGVRAILGFECARTPRLEITGQSGTRAGGDTVFTGAAGDKTDWLVQAAKRPEQAALAAPSTGSGPLSVGTDGRADAALGSGSVQAIGGVATGMSLEQATARADADFATTPRYLDDRRLLVAAEGGCDFRFDDGDAPQPGWRCLEAAFSEGSPPRAYAIGLSQAVDKDQRESIVESLGERFGPAEQVIHGREGEHPFVFLSWGEVIAADRQGRLGHINAPLRRMEAYAIARDGMTVLTIWQQDPSLVRPDEPEHRVKL